MKTQRIFQSKSSSHAQSHRPQDTSVATTGVSINPPQSGIDFVDSQTEVNGVESSARGLMTQPKMEVGSPNDVYEQEADYVATQVVQRMHAQLGGADDGNAVSLRNTPYIQCFRGQARTAVTPEFEASLRRSRGSGHSLSTPFRPKIEKAMGADFARVKVHTDVQADQLSQSIQAKAFTSGRDIYFRKGAYQPGSRDGQQVLAHELTHVAQQERSVVQRNVEDTSPSVDVGSARPETIQRLIVPEELEDIEPLHARSKSYREILDKIREYWDLIAEWTVPTGAPYRSSEGAAVRNLLLWHKHDLLKEQLEKIFWLARSKVDTHPKLKYLLADISVEQSALHDIFRDENRIDRYGAVKLAQAVTARREELGTDEASIYQDTAREEVPDDEDVVVEVDDQAVLEAVDALDVDDAKEPGKLQRMWTWFEKKLPGVHEFLGNVLGLGVSTGKLVWNVVKAAGKLVFLILKAGGKFIFKPIVALYKVCKHESVPFEKTRQAVFDYKHAGEINLAWAIIEIMNQWLGTIRDWTGWMSVISGLIGIIPGAQAFLAVSACTGAINVIAGAAKAAVSAVQLTALGIASALKRTADPRLWKMAKRTFGDITAVGITASANAVTSQAGGSGGNFFDELKTSLTLSSHTSVVAEPSVSEAWTPKGVEEALAEGAKSGEVGAPIVSGQVGAEALKEGVYLGANVTAESIDSLAESEFKGLKTALKSGLATLIGILSPLVGIFTSIAGLVSGALKGVVWFVKKIASIMLWVGEHLPAMPAAPAPMPTQAVLDAFILSLQKSANNADNAGAGMNNFMADLKTSHDNVDRGDT